MDELSFPDDYRILTEPEPTEELPEGCDRAFYPGDYSPAFHRDFGGRNLLAIDKDIRGL